MDWQDISTAPRDGTVILIWGANTGEAACYDSESAKAHSVFSRPVSAFWEPDAWGDDDSGGWWLFAYWDGDWRSSYPNPTHWMPLPEPPVLP